MRAAAFVRFQCLALLVVAVPRTALAQTPAPIDTTGVGTTLRQIAAALNVDDIAGHLHALAADSMHSRDTPSRGLELTAQYVAAEFARLGIHPEMGSPLIQRYQVPGQLYVHPESRFWVLSDLLYQDKPVVREEGWNVKRSMYPDLASDAYFAPEVGPQTVSRKAFDDISVGAGPTAFGERLVVVGGRQTAASLRRIVDTTHDKTVLYVPATSADSAARQQLITVLRESAAKVFIASEDDSTRFAAAATRARQQPARLLDDYMQYALPGSPPPPVFWLWAGTARVWLVGSGLDLTALRADTLPIVRTVPQKTVILRARGAPLRDTVTAPNVVAVVPGTDPTLQGMIVVVAHMDNLVGVPRAGRDTMNDVVSRRANDDDNTAGVAVLLAVAKAFASMDTQERAQPRRGVLFLVTSGGAHEAWGASIFTERVPSLRARSIALVLNVDMLAQTGGDSLLVDGLNDIQAPVSPRWTATRHGELGLRVVDGGTSIRPGYDDYPFTRAATPSLTIRAGAHTDPTYTGTLDADRLLRIARFVFYLAHDYANLSTWPRWTTDAHRRLSFQP